MKIRQGFVSNSSSSSFVLFIKHPEKTRSKKEFVENLGLQPGTLAHAIFGKLAEQVWNARPMKTKDLLEDYGYKTLEEFKKSEDGDHKALYIEAFEKGWEVRRVTGESDCFDAGAVFYYYHPPEVDTPAFKIISEDY